VHAERIEDVLLEKDVEPLAADRLDDEAEHVGAEVRVDEARARLALERGLDHCLARFARHMAMRHRSRPAGNPERCSRAVAIPCQRVGDFERSALGIAGRTRPVGIAMTPGEGRARSVIETRSRRAGRVPHLLDLGADMLGFVVEAISGQRLDIFSRSTSSIRSHARDDVPSALDLARSHRSTELTPPWRISTAR